MHYIFAAAYFPSPSQKDPISDSRSSPYAA